MRAPRANESCILNRYGRPAYLSWNCASAGYSPMVDRWKASRWAVWVAGLSVLSASPGCQPKVSTAAPKAASSPAKVSSPSKEDDLATVTLTPAAETRLAIATAPVQRKPIPRTTSYGGDV